MDNSYFLVAANDDVFLCLLFPSRNWSNHRIQVFSVDGRCLSSWESSGSGVGQFSNLLDIAVRDGEAVCV
jgi:hypothetical protein